MNTVTETRRRLLPLLDAAGPGPLRVAVDVALDAYKEAFGIDGRAILADVRASL